MSWLKDLIANDQDLAKMEASFTRIGGGLMGQVVNVLLPVVEQSAVRILSQVTITAGPITIEPVKVKVEIGEAK